MQNEVLEISENLTDSFETPTQRRHIENIFQVTRFIYKEPVTKDNLETAITFLTGYKEQLFPDKVDNSVSA